LSSKKEVEAGYGEDLRDEGNNTQSTSPHPSVHVSAITFLIKLLVNKKCVHSLGFKVSS
jgi:hypothetical protein